MYMCMSHAHMYMCTVEAKTHDCHVQYTCIIKLSQFYCIHYVYMYVYTISLTLFLLPYLKLSLRYILGAVDEKLSKA